MGKIQEICEMGKLLKKLVLEGKGAELTWDLSGSRRQTPSALHEGAGVSSPARYSLRNGLSSGR